MIACVMQDDRLFSGSVRENICGFAENIDGAWMVERAARSSFIHEVIIKMPVGYEALISEPVARFSGGQKPRVFIAQALYRCPGILCMDEAISALNTESENYVNQAIKHLNITRIIIAHREITVKSAAQVVLLNASAGYD